MVTADFPRTLKHEVRLEEPDRSIYIQLGYSIKSLYEGDFYKGILINKPDRRDAVQGFVEDFVNRARLDFKDILRDSVLNTRLPLPRNDVIIALVNGFETKIKTNLASNTDDHNNLVQMLTGDLLKEVDTPENILAPYLFIAEELASEFHKVHDSNFFDSHISDLRVADVIFYVDRNQSFDDEKESSHSYPGKYLETKYRDLWGIEYSFDLDKLNCPIYLAFPFMLMHEFVSHIYTSDFGEVGKPRILSRAFLEGWLVWAIYEFLRKKRFDIVESCSSKITFWERRLREFEMIILPRFWKSYKGSERISKGQRCAQWFSEMFSWEKFMKVTQDLICLPSMPDYIGDRLDFFSPIPSNLHDNFIDLLDDLITRSEFDPSLKKRLKDNCKSYNSIFEWWGGLKSE